MWLSKGLNKQPHQGAGAINESIFVLDPMLQNWRWSIQYLDANIPIQEPGA